MRSGSSCCTNGWSITTVYVTHDQIEAMTLGDKIAVMKDGVNAAVRPPDDIYNRPVNTFVAGFMGSPPMNLIPHQPSWWKPASPSPVEEHGKQAAFTLPLHILPSAICRLPLRAHQGTAGRATRAHD